MRVIPLVAAHSISGYRNSCALLLARGDQLKPSGSVRGAGLLSEPAELEN